MPDNLRQLVLQLVGPTAYEQEYRPLSNVPGMVESVGDTVEMRLRRGEDPISILRDIRRGQGTVSQVMFGEGRTKKDIELSRPARAATDPLIRQALLRQLAQPEKK